MRFSFSAAATLLAAAALTGSTDLYASVTIYATNHMGHHPNLGSDTLIKFNADDPANFTTIGSLGVENTGFGGLEFDSEGNLWAYATFNSFGGAASGLYQIDLKTGAATLQGTDSGQSLTDLAFNPIDQSMYGVATQGFGTSRLYQVNLETGSVTVVGVFSGLESFHNLVGAAFDSRGELYVFDNVNSTIFHSNDDFELTALYTIPDEVFNGSQGIAIDWSRDDLGYHGAIGQGEFPNYFSQLNTFALDGSSYVWGESFGPNFSDGLVPVQAGDLAILPTDREPVGVGDLNGDGVVDVFDLLLLLDQWGTCPNGTGCPADLNGDGVVDVFDLLVLLDNWE